MNTLLFSCDLLEELPKLHPYFSHPVVTEQLFYLMRCLRMKETIIG